MYSCCWSGVTVTTLGSMKDTIATALQQDMSAISALRCLRLFLERLGSSQDPTTSFTEASLKHVCMGGCSSYTALCFTA